MIFDLPAYDDHRLVAIHRDPHRNLVAIIAIHRSFRGRALGGCRAQAYPSEREALIDVLRLSRGMSYKSAMAGVPCGGAKSVVLMDGTANRRQLFEAMGEVIESYQGRYVTAVDAGLEDADLLAMKSRTPWVLGTDDTAGHNTATGVLIGIRSAVKRKLGKGRLAGVSVAIQGVGRVGSELAKLLAAENARLIVCDVDPTRAARCAAQVGAAVIGNDEILDAAADVFAPCALGGVINDDAVARLTTPIVCGAANNQLELPIHGDRLRDKGIFYAPDYVVNSGGLIGGVCELLKHDEAWMKDRLGNIAATLDEIADYASSHRISESAAADRIAEARIVKNEREG